MSLRIAWRADLEFVNSRMQQELSVARYGGIQSSFNVFKLTCILWEKISCRNIMGIMFTIWVNKINSYAAFIKVRLRGSIRISNYLFFDEFESSSKVWILFCFSNAAKAFFIQDFRDICRWNSSINDFKGSILDIIYLTFCRIRSCCPDGSNIL